VTAARSAQQARIDEVLAAAICCRNTNRRGGTIGLERSNESVKQDTEQLHGITAWAWMLTHTVDANLDWRRTGC
jgi:hypothetical protein